MKRIMCIALIVGAPMSLNAWAAGDVSAGSTKAKVCAGCHGINGYSSNDLWPNLAKQKRGYLVAQIKAFRDGDRTNAMMQPMVISLTDQDVEDIAAFYAQLK